MPFTPEKFCEVLGPRNVLIVGDSIMRQLHHGLTGALKSGGEEQCLTQITSLRNDNLSLKPPRDGLFSRSRTFADDWTGAVLTGKYDVVVLNTAMHILSEIKGGKPWPPEFTGNMDDDVYRDKVTAAAQFLRHNFNGTVIYVTAYAGHDCYSRSVPLTEAPSLDFGRSNRFKWWRVYVPRRRSLRCGSGGSRCVSRVVWPGHD